MERVIGRPPSACIDCGQLQEEYIVYCSDGDSENSYCSCCAAKQGVISDEQVHKDYIENLHILHRYLLNRLSEVQESIKMFDKESQEKIYI